MDATWAHAYATRGAVSKTGPRTGCSYSGNVQTVSDAPTLSFSAYADAGCWSQRHEVPFNGCLIERDLQCRRELDHAMEGALRLRDDAVKGVLRRFKWI